MLATTRGVIPALVADNTVAGDPGLRRDRKIPDDIFFQMTYEAKTPPEQHA